MNRMRLFSDSGGILLCAALMFLIMSVTAFSKTDEIYHQVRIEVWDNAQVREVLSIGIDPSDIIFDLEEGYM